MDTEFVLEALEEALEKGHLEKFNTDQGSEFTSRDFTSKLLDASIEVGMDGRGRATGGLKKKKHNGLIAHSTEMVAGSLFSFALTI